MGQAKVMPKMNIYKCYLTYRRRVWWFTYKISTFVYNYMVIIHALK